MLSGPQPNTDGLWGVSLEVHDAIKSVLREPESYKYEHLLGLSPDVRGGVHCWRMTISFRAKNGFGGYSEGIANVWVVAGSPERILDVSLESQN